jgi:ATP-dependent DNA helicase RecQ
MGHDFRPEYRNLKHIIKQLGDVLLLAYRNCHTKSSRRYSENLDMSDATTLRHHLIGQIYITKCTKTKNIESDIIRFIKQHKENQGLFIA